jgi:hypothetical protein
MAKTVGAILGDIYDAWRAQDVDWLASYLPDDFCHVIHIPTTIHHRHRGTGTVLETTKANFWTLEDGWPVRLTEYYDVTDLQAFFGPVAPHAQA